MPENRLKTTSSRTNEPVGGNSVKPAPLWTRDFVLITLCNLLVFLAFHSMPAALPVYLKGLGLQDSMLGWAVGLTTITVIISRPFSGAGVDIIGRKRFMVIGLIGLLITIGPVGLVPSIAYIMVMRILLGVAWGAANTAATTAAADVIPRARFGEGMGYFSLSSAIALAFAPAGALIILDIIDFNMVAIVAAVLIVLALICSLFIKYKAVPARDKDEAKVVAAVGVAQPKQTPKRPRQILHEMFDKSAVLPGIIILFSNMVYGSITTFMALLGYERGIDNIALFFVFYAVAVIFSRPFSGKVVDKRGYFLPITLGLLCMSLGLAVVVFAPSLPLFLVAALIFGLGQGCIVSSMQTMAVADAPFERRGAATSTFFIFFDAGIGFGAMVSGTVASVLGYAGMYGCYIILPIVGLVIYLLFARHRKNPTAQR